MNPKRLVCNFSWAMLCLILLNQSMTASHAESTDANPTLVGASSHRDCSIDSDCIAFTSISGQGCHHIDPQVQRVCPAVNRTYAKKVQMTECFINQGCREVINISCQQGLCAGVAATSPLSIEDTLGKYGFWSKPENVGCQRIFRKLTKNFNQCIVGETWTLTGNRFYVCSSDKYGKFLAYNTKAACIEDLKALKAAHLLR